MKKLLVSMMVLVMTLSITACGVDKKAVTDAFNTTNTQLNTVTTFANDNLDKMTGEVTDALTEVANSMAAFKAEIESSDLSQARADEIIAELKNYPSKIAELKTQVDALIAGGSVGFTKEHKNKLTDISKSLTELHAKYKEHYDSFNDETKAFVDEIALTINDLGDVLDGKIKAENINADILIEGSQEVLKAAQTGWTEIEAQLAK